jgi:hypothetical protein
MTHLIISNESDMEEGLRYTCKLACSENEPTKNLDLSFPSEGLMAIFMNNLFAEFLYNKISPRCGLNMTIHVPGEEGRGHDEIE